MQGLGLLGGSLSVHLDGEAERLPVYRAAMADGELPPGYAVDDGAALLYAGTRLLECVASTPGARVLRYEPDGHGDVIETELAIRVLAEADREARRSAAPGDISELRALRAGRHRWH